MLRPILVRTGLYFLCGVLLILVFDVFGALFLRLPCDECWIGESPVVVWSLFFAVLPLIGLAIFLGNECWRQRIKRFSLTAQGPQPRNLHVGTSSNAGPV